MKQLPLWFFITWGTEICLVCSYRLKKYVNKFCKCVKGVLLVYVEFIESCDFMIFYCILLKCRRSESVISAKSQNTSYYRSRICVRMIFRYLQVMLNQLKKWVHNDSVGFWTAKLAYLRTN